MVDDSAPVEVDLGHLAEDAQVDGALAVDGLHLVLQAVIGAACEEESHKGNKENELISHDDVIDMKEFFEFGCKNSELIRLSRHQIERNQFYVD